MPFPTTTFPNFAALMTYINNVIIPNGAEEIDGDEMNSVVNGLLGFIEQSPLNYQKALVINTVGAANVTQPINVFITGTPSSLQWVDNIYNQYVFVNTTNSAIMIGGGLKYYDINLAVKTTIPAKTIVSIAKATNNLWISIYNASGGGGTVLTPLTGVVGGGGDDDPVNGQSVFQNNKLIGLGAANNGRIQIQIDEANQSNYGNNSSFAFDFATGEIDISPNIFVTGSSLYIDLNQ